MAPRTLLPIAAAGALALASAGLGSTAAYAGAPLPGPVSSIPSHSKPTVDGGQCYAKSGSTTAADPTKCRRVLVLKRIGSWVYAGGIIDSVEDHSSGHAVQVAGLHNLFRFDASTGAVDQSFKPQLFKSAMTGTGLEYKDSAVTGIAGNAGNLYVAGSFTQVAANQSSGAVVTVRKGVVDLNPTDGTVTTAFNAQLGNGGGSTVTNDVELVNGTLWIGGLFTHLNRSQTAQGILAILSPSTGLLTGPQVSFSGQVTTTVGTKVAAIAVDNASTRAAVIGNFTTVGGATHDEVVVLNVTAAGSASVDGWNSPALAASNSTNCSDSDTWARGVDWSPDNVHFDVVASGGGGFTGYRTYGALCDAFSRFDSTKANAAPDIVNDTGFDSLFTVVDTGDVVYTGGHNKLLDYDVFVNGSPLANPGLLKENHYGIGAIDVKAGDPGYGKAVTAFDNSVDTGRGAGWTASLSTGAGVYLGGDAEQVGTDTSIDRLAYFTP